MNVRRTSLAVLEGLGFVPIPPVLAVPLIGAVTGIIGDFISSLGKLIGIRGRTQHLSYEEVLPRAQRFEAEIRPLFVQAYGEQNFAAIARPANRNWLREMNSWWGPSPNWVTQNIRNSLVTAPQHLYFTNFFLWVWTNVDADQARMAENERIFQALFRSVFIEAIQEAGFDPNKAVQVQPGSAAASGGGLTQAAVPVLLGIGLLLALPALMKGRS